MPKPTRLEHHKWVGDKRTQRVYDLDVVDTDVRVADAVAAIMAAESFAVFGPDTLPEARNRGYRPRFVSPESLSS